MYACKRVGICVYIKYKGTTAAGKQYYQASTDRHQQHSKEHNTQQPITQQHHAREQ